jgi:hypothetical protein
MPAIKQMTSRGRRNRYIMFINKEVGVSLDCDWICGKKEELI